MFQEGLDIAHEHVLRVLEVMWMKFIDDASHYNHITRECFDYRCVKYDHTAHILPVQ